MLWPFQSRKKKDQTKSSSVVINILDETYVADFCLSWNLIYPIDRWWRTKYKVAFNSERHRSVSLLDMRFEFEEEMMFYKSEQIRSYAPNKGQWLKDKIDFNEDEELTQEEKLEKYKKEFEEMDIDQYNDPIK